MLLVVVFALAWSQAKATAPGVRESRQVLVASVRAAEATTDELAGRRDELSAAVDTERRSRLEGERWVAACSPSSTRPTMRPRPRRSSGPG